MVFKIDHLEDGVYEWAQTETGITCTRNPDYTPTIYVAADGADALETVRPHLHQHPRTTTVERERWQTGWRNDVERVLRVDVATIDDVTPVASRIQEWGPDPDSYRLFNVDFSREFRYCLETELDPTPAHPLAVMELAVPKHRLSNGRITPFSVDETTIDDAETALEALRSRLEREDPDVLVLSHSDIVPTLFETADRLGVDLELGRLPGYQRLAGRSTYESYGAVGHSPARYNVPGRAIVDRSNTFFWNQTTLEGVLDLVHRSYKPVQELSWASIGNVLTAVQIREATDRGVLVPWKAWRPEWFKSMATLHEADRGGVTFSPTVGVHENVAEIDFASLYPNIMVTRNVSPETIRCECHRERRDVPGLGYSVCDDRGYLADVLEPIIDDRQAFKAEARATDDPDEEAALRGKAEALKWILVSCFGYQGFSNAKFGRIECHEAINAYAREILLETKATLEAHGWTVIHGIVDSLWVTPDGDEADGNAPTPLSALCADLTEEIGIPLEYERDFDWIAFAPRRNSDAGALNRYFGKCSESDEYKIRGLEYRQRDTPAYVERCQHELIEAFDRHRDPERVCFEVGRQCRRLTARDVDPNELVIRTTPSKRREEYRQYTTTVAALERAERQGIDVHPGEPLEYVVIDDSRASHERVALAHETDRLEAYDADYYTRQLYRAAESVLSPVGYRRADVRRALAESRAVSLRAFE